MILKSSNPFNAIIYILGSVNRWTIIQECFSATTDIGGSDEN
jgi:hypothetical protein